MLIKAYIPADGFVRRKMRSKGNVMGHSVILMGGSLIYTHTSTELAPRFSR